MRILVVAFFEISSIHSVTRSEKQKPSQVSPLIHRVFDIAVAPAPVNFLRMSTEIALSWDRIELNRGNAGRWFHPAPPVTVQDHPPNVREPTRWGLLWELPTFLPMVRCPKVFRL